MIDGPDIMVVYKIDRLSRSLAGFARMIKWLLRMIAKKGIPFLWAVLLCLLQAIAKKHTWPAQPRWSLRAAPMMV